MAVAPSMAKDLASRTLRFVIARFMPGHDSHLRTQNYEVKRLDIEGMMLLDALKYIKTIDDQLDTI